MTMLDDFIARLKPGTDGRLALDRALIGDRLADDFLALFASDTLSLASAMVQPAAAGAPYQTVTGVGDLLGISGLPIAVTFFTSDGPAGTAPALEWLVVTRGVPAAWRLNYAYPQLPGSFDHSPAAAGEPAQPSFVADLAFTDVQPFYSSFDFTPPDPGAGPTPVALLPTIPMFGDRPMRAGLNFTCELTCDGTLWAAVQKILAPIGAIDQLDLLGLISNDSIDGPQLDLRHSLANPDTGAFPTLSFGGAGALKLGLREIGVTSGLTEGSERPSLLIAGFVTSGEIKLDLDIMLPVNAPTASLRARFDATPLTLPQIESLAGLQNLTSALPASVQSLGGLGLADLQATLSVADSRLEQLILVFTTAQPWTIVPNILSITPLFSITVMPGGADGTALDIGVSGDWLLGSTRFETFVSITDGGFSASMAPGQSLDIGAVFDRFLPKSERPNLAIVDLDVYGDLTDGSFGFELETHDTWDFSLGGKMVSIGDIEIAGDYDGTSFSGTVQGTLGIAGGIVRVNAEMAGQITLAVTIDVINVSTLTDELLTLVKLPAEVPDFELRDIALTITPSAGLFSLSGSSDTPLQLFSGFDVELAHFAVGRTPADAQGEAKRVQADIAFVFKIGQVALNAAASNVAIEGGPAPSSQWMFVASSSGQAITIGDMLDALEHMVGLSYPLPTTGLQIGNLNVSFDLGGTNRHFAAACDLEYSGQTYGRLSLVAQHAAAQWDYIFALDATLDVGLGDIPVIGSSLSRLIEVKLDSLQVLDASRDFTDTEVSTLHAFSGANSITPLGALSSGQKWLLNFSSTAGGLDAGALLQDLAGDLKITLPQAMTQAAAGLRLSTFDIGINAATRAFSLIARTSGQGKVAIGPTDHALDLVLNVSSFVDAKSGARTMGGHFEADLAMGAATFVVTFDFGQAEIVTGRWTSLKGETLGVADIVRVLGVASTVDIPNGLDLDLTSAAFEYRSDRQAFILSATSAKFGDAFFTLAKDIAGVWGFVFGVDSPKAGKLSDLPAIGDELRAADFLSIEQASFLLASGSFNAYTVPALPALPPEPAASAAAPAPAGRTIAPIAAGVPLQLSQGLSLAAVIDLTTSNDRRIGNLKSIVGQSKLMLQVSLASSAITLSAALPGSVAIPAGGSSSLRLGNAFLTIAVTPEIIFQMAGSLAFTINGTPVNATAKLILSETEAEVAATLSAGQVQLPGPPGVKGLHFGEFGIEMGVFFEPPGADLGVQGQLRIGPDQSLHTDQFALVLEMMEEIPNLLYLAFYVDKLDLGQVVTLFTDLSDTTLIAQLQVVKASDLSFHWCDSVVVLPDGTTWQPGFGFSGTVQIFSFGAHVALEIGAPKGIAGTAEMSPIALGNVLHVSGAGKGIVRVQQNVGGTWTEVDNTKIVRQTPTPATRREVVILPGGPVIAFNTQSPYLSASLDVTFFDLVHAAVEATISQSGFSFTLTFNVGGLAKFDMHCVLAGPEHFGAGAALGIHLDASIGPLSFAGVNVGSIHLVADLQANISITLDPSNFELDLAGWFRFEGLNLTMPTLKLSIAPASLAELPGDAIKQIRACAQQLFQALVGDVRKWADMIGRGVITGVSDMAGTLKNAYHVTAQEAAQLMHQAKQTADVVASGLKTAYGASQDVATAALKGAGYSANEVASGLKSGYALSAEGVAAALKGGGFAVDEVGGALKSAYGFSGQQTATVLKSVGYGAGDVGDALKHGYGFSAQQAAVALKGANYAVNDVGNALKTSYGFTANGAAQVLKGAGYGVNDVGNALKAGWGLTSDGAAAALCGAGFAVDQTGNFVKSAYGLSEDQMRSALQKGGYAADQVKRAFGDAGSAISGIAHQAGSGIVNIGNRAGGAISSGWHSFTHLF